MSAQFCLLIIAAHLALAFQIQQCDGVWTDRPCGEPPSHSANAASSQIRENGQDGLSSASRKEFLFRDLDLRRFDAERRYGFNFSIEAARSICHSEGSAIHECEKAVNDAYKELDQRIVLALEREKAEIERSKAQREQGSDGGTSISVVQQTNENNIIVVPRQGIFDRERDGALHPDGHAAKGGLKQDSHPEPIGVLSIETTRKKADRS
ncbi:MAG: hypothetical protein DCC75_04730 [Proteobacteria bacterium]|nr:MAG: hypothetical protein DCC75_04730 [Pseudomonadota bacterium]